MDDRRRGSEEKRGRAWNSSPQTTFVGGRAAAACAAVACVLAAGPARAQDDPSGTLRFAVGIGGGYGWTSLERFNVMVRDIEGAVERTGVTVEGADDTHGTAFAGLSVRGYLPYFIAAEVGFGVMYAHDEATARAGPASVEIEHNELGFEVPILVGGYYPFLGQLFVSALVGPAVLAGPSSLWDQSGDADMNDFQADTTVGFMAVLAADWFPIENLALGIDVRYRYLVSDVLEYDTGSPPTDGTIVESGHLRGDGTHETYDLSFSGISVQAMIKFAI